MDDILKSENKKLQHAVTELSVLNDIATAINSLQPVEEIIEKIIFRCIKHLNVEEGSVGLLEEIEEEQKFKTMIRKQDVTKVRLPYRLDNQLTGWMLKNKMPLLVNNLKSDDRFKYLEDEKILFGSLLCVPMIIKGKLIGYLVVFNKKDGSDFLEEDKRLLSIIAVQSAQIIENARLYEEEKAFFSLKEEMRLAAEIQQKLLPDSIPEITGYQIAAISIPAKEVGGDYYDFFELEDGRTGICLGDITGKGITAALLMSNLQAALRSQSIISTDCALSVRNTNKLLFRSTESGKFATLFYAALDSENHTLEYCNGGHDAPIIFKQNETEIELPGTGLILGFLESSEYQKEKVNLEQGDILIIYSDGVTEAMSSEKKEFGLEKLKALVKVNTPENPEVIKNKILAELSSHSRGAEQSDDITLIIVKRI